WNCVKTALKGHNGHHGRHHIASARPAHDRGRNRHRHFLSGANNLRPAYHHATPIHPRQHFAHALVDFGALDIIGLESAMKLAAYGPDGESDQVRILFKSFLQARIVSRVVEGIDAARYLESAHQAGDEVAVSL